MLTSLGKDSLEWVRLRQVSRVVNIPSLESVSRVKWALENQHFLVLFYGFRSSGWRVADWTEQPSLLRYTSATGDERTQGACWFRLVFNLSMYKFKKVT